MLGLCACLTSTALVVSLPPFTWPVGTPTDGVHGPDAAVDPGGLRQRVTAPQGHVLRPLPGTCLTPLPSLPSSPSRSPPPSLHPTPTHPILFLCSLLRSLAHTRWPRRACRCPPATCTCTRRRWPSPRSSTGCSTSCSTGSTPRRCWPCSSSPPCRPPHWGSHTYGHRYGRHDSTFEGREGGGGSGEGRQQRWVLESSRERGRGSVGVAGPLWTDATQRHVHAC